MTHSPKKPTPPEGLPERLVSDLDQLNDDQLRKTIIHAQELLQFHEETSSPIKPGPGEDIIQVTEHDGYTKVVKRIPCAEGCSDCPHGPYLYHVRQEPHSDGTETLHWTFLGEVQSDDE